MNIKEILKSKPHNSHYLNRYIKFIESRIGRNIEVGELYENHHICPKADDLFPEYADFIQHDWNCIRLKIREHIVAHVLLWKVYGGSQRDAIHYILNVHNTRKIPTIIQIRYSEKAKTDHYLARRGMSTYKDSEGNKYFLHREDPLISELDLVGNAKGFVMSEDSKILMSERKDKYKVITLYKEEKQIKIKKENINERDSLMEQGWKLQRDKSDYEKIKKIQYEKVSASMKDRCKYYDESGNYYGTLRRDDPDILKYKLKYIASEKVMGKLHLMNEAAKKANTGKEYWNNGIECRKFLPEDIKPEGWVRGILRNNSNIINGAKAANTGKEYWNNGIECRKFLPEDIKPEGWVRGMLKRK